MQPKRPSEGPARASAGHCWTTKQGNEHVSEATHKPRRARRDRVRRGPVGDGREQAASTDQGAGVEEIVVTGSRIQRANEVTSSPVVQLDAEQFQFTGSPRVEDTVRSLPQVYADQDSGQSIEADGTATVQLRNLGDIRTLVLIDGKRLPTNFNGGASVQTGPDLNSIPVGLVDRVEVLTGGASATYGSDAVAGVVNFTMKDDFEGVSFDIGRSSYRHDNNGNVTSNPDDTRAVSRPQAAPSPTATSRTCRC